MKKIEKYVSNINWFDDDCVHQDRRAPGFDKYAYFYAISYHQYIFTIFSRIVVAIGRFAVELYCSP